MPQRRSLPVVAAVLLPLVPLLVACGGGSSSTTARDAAADSPSESQSSTTSNVSCDYPDAPQGKTGDASKPPTTPDVQGKVSVTLKTTIGDLGATLDADKTPCTVNSFVSLARQGFFDNSPCHRLTTAESGIFVLQCGDPTGTGTSGPGYTIPDELTGKETYGPGTVAMAKTQQPDSGGSQFFIVYRNTPLPPRYTVFGQLDAAGLKDVQKAARQGSDNAFGPGDGHPKVSVTIDSVTTG
ncbi:MAG TPA: peptidylprolyl isomerase [Nocardioides sp.]|uniref:peptidylprolyl isomerase n=1 Tax=Nocardioides sp. TaxID=35761 RepID=UPI002F3F181C